MPHWRDIAGRLKSLTKKTGSSPRVYYNMSQGRADRTFCVGRLLNAGQLKDALCHKKNENDEWSDGPRARAAVWSRSNLHVRGQDICLRFERAGRKYRRLCDGYEYWRPHGDWQGRGRQDGHADVREPQ